MPRIDSYTIEQDNYLKENYKTQTHKQLGEALGRTPDSVKARLKQLNLYKLKPQYFNKKGVPRKGYKHILHSDWKTKLDTPCPMLRLCSRCEELFPTPDFYIDNISGSQDILGSKRTVFCPDCATKNFMDIDPRKRMIYAARQRAKRDGRECTIKEEDIKLLDYCPILGIRLKSSTADERKKSSETDNSHSLDRVDNSKGYTPGNILIMSNKANKLKRDGCLDEILPITAYLMAAEMGQVLSGDRQHVPYAERDKEEILRLLEEYESFGSENNGGIH